VSRPKLEVADIFRDHGAAWRAANAGHVSLDQLKVMTAIERCRTAALGGHVERCEKCAHTVIAYNSCRNRHCPKCQGAAAQEWLAEREAELLPVPYFHVVFTLPARIADIAYQNKAVIYDLLFKAAPPGCAAMTLLCLLSEEEATRWFQKDRKAYLKSKDEFSDRLITSCETIIPRLSTGILYRQTAAPPTFTRYTLTRNGSIYGAARGQWCPAIKSPVPGLLLAGAGCQNGPGVEAAVISGMASANLICGQAKKRPPAE
jgi:Transposase zinc-binding domain